MDYIADTFNNKTAVANLVENFLHEITNCNAITSEMQFSGFSIDPNAFKIHSVTMTLAEFENLQEMAYRNGFREGFDSRARYNV